MANEYADAASIIARTPSLGTFDLDELNAALEAASRWIDGYCGRKFWLDPEGDETDRVFKACDLYVLDLGEHELGAATVTVKTDDGTGTFPTTVAPAAYQLEPVNAPYATSGARPYTQIRALTTSWPLSYSRGGRQELVQVTGRFGWPAVPAVIRETCLAIATVQVENPTGVRAEAIDGYSVSYSRGTAAEAESGVSAAIRARLAPYRRAWTT